MSDEIDFIVVSKQEAKQMGRDRQMGHVKAGNSSRRFTDDMFYEDTLGAAGELAFEKWSGLKADKRVLPNGDSHIDFTMTVKGRKLSIDVKTAKKPYHLLVKKHEVMASSDILVLAGEESEATGQNINVWFLGWEHKSMMQIMPCRDFGKGIDNFYRHYSELRPMWQLRKLLRLSKELT